jgi:hypothetical protein
MANFVFGFVLSTATVFQQLPRFVLGLFGFVFWPRPFVFNNLSGLFLKIKLFSSHLSQKARKLAFPLRWNAGFCSAASFFSAAIAANARKNRRAGGRALRYKNRPWRAPQIQ